MRRVPVLFFALSVAVLAVLAACGVRTPPPGSQAPLAVAPVTPEAPEAPLRLAIDARHAYLYRVGGRDYVSLDERAAAAGPLPLRKVVAGKAKAIRLLAADPAQARAILRSLKLPASQRKVWMGEEIVLDAASYERLRTLSGKGKPLLMAQLELQPVRLEK